MPWPFVPPDPDIPAPVATPGRGVLVPFALTLTGMRPYEEQHDHRFYVDGSVAAIHVPTPTVSGKESWTGVCLARLSGNATAVYKSRYLPREVTRAVRFSVRREELPARVLGVEVTTSGDKAVFSVYGKTPAFGYRAVVVPYAEVLPRFSAAQGYAELGASADLGSGGRAQVTVRAAGVKTFAVYLARGGADQPIPASVAVPRAL